MKAGVQRICRDRYRTAVAWLVESQTQAAGMPRAHRLETETESSKVKDLLQLVVSAASQGPMGSFCEVSLCALRL